MEKRTIELTQDEITLIDGFIEAELLRLYSRNYIGPRLEMLEELREKITAPK